MATRTSRRVQAVWARDYPVLEGCFLLLSTYVLGLNLAMAALLTSVDPRIRVRD